jgi:RimJ/RimL family protein N-acetyltransferase
MPENPSGIAPITLSGRFVRLEPVEERHAEDLARNATLETFRYFVTLQPEDESVEAMREFVRKSRLVPNMLPFAVVLEETGEAVGMTSYLDIRAEHRGTEVGYTWYTERVRGTAVNPECKLLLLEHAFEGLGYERVQLKTDSRNLQSQAAIRKLGAKFEGILRRHLVLPDGYVRDTAMFSVIRPEWAQVRRTLEERLSKF